MNYKVVARADASRSEEVFKDFWAADEDEAIGFDLLSVGAMERDVSEVIGAAQSDGQLLDVVGGSSVVRKAEALSVQFNFWLHDF